MEITFNNFNKIAHQIAIKKRDLENPNIVNNLHDLLSTGRAKTTDETMAILAARQMMLENDIDIWLEEGQDEIALNLQEELDFVDALINHIKELNDEE